MILQFSTKVLNLPVSAKLSNISLYLIRKKIEIKYKLALLIHFEILLYMDFYIR